MRRLYLQIYVSFVAILIVFLVLMSLTWWLLRDRDDRVLLNGMALLIAQTIPSQSAPQNELDAAVSELADMFSARVTLRGRDGALLAHTGKALPLPPPEHRRSGLHHRRGAHPVALLRLPDGRWVVATQDRGKPRYGWLIAIALLAITIAAGAYPLVRRITRRLETLQSSVEALGSGALDARVRVEGKDEVANLAISFNRAAQRIEELVNAQREMLATASHELRSPLARMRMALELLKREDRPELREQLEKDISELDDLVGEILLATRMQAIDKLERNEQIDLLALLTEEARHYHTPVRMAAGTREPVSVRGDSRLLRRLIRNLLDNARRHSGGAAVEASIERDRDGAVLLHVDDRGPGVAESERERIFEPFYRSPSARETGEGFGLGLSLVKQIVQRHGGQVRCLPRDGGGTRFEVTFPGKA